MSLVPEFRVVYRREGGQKQYRVFQRRGNAVRFLDDLMKDTRKDLAPLIELGFETRQCGDWSPIANHAYVIDLVRASPVT